jgi:Helitron helicase-like domain at N-terminus
MYSRIEEERLAYIQRSHVSRAQEIHADVDESSVDIELPASFLGSHKWASEQTADSLALACAFRKPSYFFMMTCNPEWPEITARLQPGQNASDVPVVVVQAFEICLQRLLQILHTCFGHLVYMIKVIEFQKCGFPHAHIIAKVSNSFTLVMR